MGRSTSFRTYDDEKKIFIQQDGFLDKEFIDVAMSINQRPINQNWSWDRILRSVYIKQADVLQGFYFFPENFTNEELEKNYKFYENSLSMSLLCHHQFMLF